MNISKSLVGFLKRAAAPALLAGAALCTAACGPSENYSIYKLAFGASTLGDSCVPDEFDPNFESDSNSFLSSETVILYTGPNDTFYLDTGEITLSGTRTDNTYTFTAESVDVEWSLPDGQGDKETETATTNITMTVDGSKVSGTADNRSTKEYNCVDPMFCPSNTDCSSSTSFTGIKLEGVELEHDPG